MSLKFNKVDTVSLFLKGIGNDCEWSHYLLRLLAEFMVELRLEPIKARGLSIVLDIPLQRQSYQNQGKSGWSKISMCCIRLYTLILSHCESLINVSNFIMIEKNDWSTPKCKDDKVKYREHLFFLYNFFKFCIK